MQDLETKCLEKFDFEPQSHCHYVDDCFAIIPRSKIKHMLEVLNSYHIELRVTHEVELNGMLSFLELKLIREMNRIFTDWFQMPTSFGLLTLI